MEGIQTLTQLWHLWNYAGTSIAQHFWGNFDFWIKLHFFPTNYNQILPFYFNFFRTQVSLGTGLWVSVSVTPTSNNSNTFG